MSKDILIYTLRFIYILLTIPVVYFSHLFFVFLNNNFRNDFVNGAGYVFFMIWVYGFINLKYIEKIIKRKLTKGTS